MVQHCLYYLYSVQWKCDLAACSTIWTLCIQQATAEKCLLFSIPPSFLPSSPHRSSPTGRTSGPRPDLPSAPLLLSFHLFILPSSPLIFLNSGIHSDSEPGIQVIHQWLSIWDRDHFRLIIPTVWSSQAHGYQSQASSRNDYYSDV